MTVQTNSWDEGWGEEQELQAQVDATDEFADPLEELTSREQDIFFRIIDLLPDDKREAVMGYLMDHPRVIRAVVDNAKTKMECIKNNDVDGIKQLLAEEQVVLDKIQADGQSDWTPEDI